MMLRKAMGEIVNAVKRFHRKLGFPVAMMPIPYDMRLDERYAMRKEEWREYNDALFFGDPEDAAEELSDLLYVLIGDAVEYGIPLRDEFVVTHQSNMTKTKSPHGGKALKGPGFKTKKEVRKELY